MSLWSTDVLEKLSQKVSLVTKMNSDHGSRQKKGGARRPLTDRW